MTEPLVLGHVRVVELTTGIAGSYATKLLGDLGAEVVKVEPPAGDPLRRWSASGHRLGPCEDGVLFQFLNAGKDSVPDTATAAVDALVAGADIVVALPDQPVDAPHAVVVTLSAFGRGGPWTGRPATEFTVAAWAGAPYARGLPDRPPLSSGVAIGEYATGVAVAALALGYLGHPVVLDVSMLECITLVSGWQGITRQLTPGLYPTHRTVEIPSVEPARDGYVGVALVTAQQLEDFWVLVEKPEWVGHPDYLSMRQRWERRDEVQAVVHAWTRRHTVAEIVEQASRLRIPVTPVGNGQVLPTVDHFVATGAYVPSADGRFVQPAPAFRLSGAATRPPRPAPGLGDAVGPPPPWAPRPRPARSPAGAKPLAGLRVTSFTAYWAGPYAASILAALGADVVLVESVQRPDGMRFMSARAPSEDQWWEFGSVFHGVNAGKRGVTLDLDDPDGRAAAVALIARSDVVIENYSPRVMETFDLGYDAVRAINPSVVMARMPAFGLSGPWRDRTGFAMTIEQASGLAWLTGYPDRGPIVPRGPCDPLAGLHTLVAVLAAVEHRRRTGEGQLVEVSMVGAALNVTAEQVLEWSAYGALLERRGNAGPAADPQGLYRGADLADAALVGRDPDRYVAVAAATPRHRAAVAAVTGADAAAGAIGVADLDAALAAWCAGRDVDAVVAELWDAGVPAARVDAQADGLHNPQLRARGYWEAHDHAVTGPLEYSGLPARVVGADGRVDTSPWFTRGAPSLGQHNREILAEAGYDDATLDGWEARGVIGTVPKGVGKPI